MSADDLPDAQPLELVPGEYDEPTCPLCPPGEEQELSVRWECYVPLGSNDLSPGQASTRHWQIVCAVGHLLVSAWDWHDDDEYPDPPHLDDVIVWLGERRRPPVRDHDFTPNGFADCRECLRPKDEHEVAS